MPFLEIARSLQRDLVVWMNLIERHVFFVVRKMLAQFCTELFSLYVGCLVFKVEEEPQLNIWIGDGYINCVGPGF